MPDQAGQEFIQIAYNNAHREGWTVGAIEGDADSWTFTQQHEDGTVVITQVQGIVPGQNFIEGALPTPPIGQSEGPGHA